jgi:PEP-CTERM motif
MMKQRAFKYIIALGLVGMVIIPPTLATVLPASTNNGNVLAAPMSDIINRAMALANRTNKTNVLSVSFINVLDGEIVGSAISEVHNLSPPLLQLSSMEMVEKLPTDCTRPSDALWPISAGCDDLFYQDVSFNKTCCYFSDTNYDAVYTPDSLNFRFWKSVANYDKWDALFDKDVSPTVAPEPGTVGLLGVGILGFASLQQRNNKKQV